MNNEKVMFRLFNMPCCSTLICWVNPRIPNYCPECGAQSFFKLKSQPEHTLINTEAWLRYKDEKKTIADAELEIATSQLERPGEER